MTEFLRFQLAGLILLAALLLAPLCLSAEDTAPGGVKSAPPHAVMTATCADHEPGSPPVSGPEHHREDCCDSPESPEVAEPPTASHAEAAACGQQSYPPEHTDRLSDVFLSIFVPPENPFLSPLQ
ncbi:hypothetical protein [Geobacter sp. DSM 9736]|uniref:hypothetical protein n=1 Tax=Geobacter sp. DSM 9736 TaxID=1277350 RepID=UPI0012FD8997|nr:hypothetical protein [Geobacter sp. DSM 9736]